MDLDHWTCDESKDIVRQFADLGEVAGKGTGIKRIVPRSHVLRISPEISEVLLAPVGLGAKDGEGMDTVASISGPRTKNGADQANNDNSPDVEPQAAPQYSKRQYPGRYGR